MSPVDMNFPSSRRIEMTEIEGKYLRRTNKEKNTRLEFLIDLLLGSLLAGLIVGLLITLFILWRADRVQAAELPNDNQSLCAGFLEGKYWVSDEDVESVTTYCVGI